MSLLVVDPGLASRVVDLGRPHTRSLGVPLGGAADRASFILGNSLVGNPPEAAALEICLKGPVLRATGPLAGVLSGAPFAMSSARQRLLPGGTFTLEAEEEVHIGAAARGIRAYLCVAGGLQTPVVLGSRSGLENVAAGTTLACGAGSIHRRWCPFGSDPAWADIAVVDPNSRTAPAVTRIHVLDGLQASWFDVAEFYEQQYVVTPALDRMGIRLRGQALSLPKRELVSEAVAPGAVQVTSDGQCIVLGVDGQTIGGYPKIAQVVAADVDKLAQLRPGDRLQFVRISLEQARAHFEAYHAWLREWQTRLRISLDGFAL